MNGTIKANVATTRIVGEWCWEEELIWGEEGLKGGRQENEVNG
jgi:hypothetical protein